MLWSSESARRELHLFGVNLCVASWVLGYSRLGGRDDPEEGKGYRGRPGGSNGDVPLDRRRC